MALDAKVDVQIVLGYMPDILNKDLQDLMYENLKSIFGEDQVKREFPHSSGSSDNGDVSSIIPILQARIGGISGDLHGVNYRLVDRETAYLGSAKALVTTVIDLLYDDALAAKQVVDNYEPTYTKEDYLKEWGNIAERFK